MTKAAAPIDFADLDAGTACETPFEFELAHPATKKPLGVFVSVIGMESDDQKTWFRQKLNRERRKDFEAKRKNQPLEPNSFEEDEAETIEMCARLMRGWRTVLDGKSEPVIHWDKEKLEFNADNAARWLARFQWVRPQIIEEANAVGNYLKN